jgi:hypothetical protein
MSVAPNAGIVDLDTFLPPTVSVDGQQGQVPKPLAGQQDYVLTANGFVPGGSLPGLGTMATQNANAVAITGGTINSTTIGATTASTGAFTTLSASSTVSGTGFSTYLASPPAIGGTTPAAVTATTLIVGGGSANYGQLTGGATTKAIEFKSLGSDTNVAMALRSQGTGAIDLAAGSSGVNISNGGTVTAITRTAGGSGYTSLPTAVISVPTTAGGVQATASVTMFNSGVTIAGGGTGYTAGDVLTVVGGTPAGAAATLTVSTVSAGVITAVAVNNFGSYTALPSNPVSVTGGTGTGATFNLTYALNLLTITNAGSGYVEQPTVSFSGGGGSGASAYATVGSGAVIKWLGGTNNIQNASGNILQFQDGGNATPNALVIKNGGAPQLFPSVSNTDLYLSSAGTGNLRFYTNSVAQTQMVVSHTASAVNYVQVTGGATTVRPRIDFTGSDTNVGGAFVAKGSGAFVFASDANASTIQFFISRTGSAVNYLQVTGAASGSSPTISSQGSGTDLDINLTPKGTGVLSFGTYTASVLTVTGYISIKDSGGTTRRLLVG